MERSCKIIQVADLGTTRYETAWDLQRNLFALRTEGQVPDTLLLTEHYPVYTFGKSSNPNHLLASESDLAARGIDVLAVDRGGDVTFHGPGQVVGYPILDLNGFYLDIHRYLRDLENVLIQTLESFGVYAARDEGFTGVWVGTDKIAAIGVRVSRWVTMHGFALNVNTDLSYFDRIIPCGIFHKGVTSIEKLVGKAVDVNEVGRILVDRFEKVFGVRCVAIDPLESVRSSQISTLEKEKCPQIEKQ